MREGEAGPRNQGAGEGLWGAGAPGAQAVAGDSTADAVEKQVLAVAVAARLGVETEVAVVTAVCSIVTGARLVVIA